MARTDVWLLLRFTLASEGAPGIHAARERSVHEFIIHLLLVLLPGYGLAGDYPAPIHRRYLWGNFRQALEAEGAESIFLVSFCYDMRGYFRIELWKYDATVSMDLCARLIHDSATRRTRT